MKNQMAKKKKKNTHTHEAEKKQGKNKKKKRQKKNRGHQTSFEPVCRRCARIPDPDPDLACRSVLVHRHCLRLGRIDHRPRSQRRRTE